MLTYVIIYGIILFSGIPSNIFVVCAILGLRRLRTTQNIFVMNLCFADLLLAVNNLLLFIREINDDVVPRGFACRVIGFLTAVPPFAVILSMVFIAKNRCSTITQYTNPAKSWFHKRKIVAVLLGFIWIVSICFSLPILTGMLTINSGTVCACCLYFKTNLTYGICITVAIFVLPNGLIAYYYIRILCFVKVSNNRVHQHGSLQSHIGKREIRLACQFIILFLVFNICYLPSFILFWIEDKSTQISIQAKGIIMIIFALNLVLNPVVYFMFNTTARREIRYRLCCGICRPKYNGDPNERYSRSQSNSVGVTMENDTHIIESNENGNHVTLKHGPKLNMDDVDHLSTIAENLQSEDLSRSVDINTQYLPNEAMPMSDNLPRRRSSLALNVKHALEQQAKTDQSKINLDENNSQVRRSPKILKTEAIDILNTPLNDTKKQNIECSSTGTQNVIQSDHINSIEPNENLDAPKSTERRWSTLSLAIRAIRTASVRSAVTETECDTNQ